MYHKVYCITTRHNGKRQSLISKYWKDWDIEFFYGIDWRDLNIPQEHGGLFGSLCCTISHALLWKKLEGIKWPLIIEDDSTPLDSLPYVCESIVINPPEFDIIKFYHTEEDKSKLGTHKAASWMSTMGYLVRDTTLLEPPTVPIPIDTYLTKYRVGCYFPNQIVHSGVEKTIPYNFKKENKQNDI